MLKLVLLRHGESIWNQENRFTGWTDVDLSEEGLRQAWHAGDVLRQHGYMFDIGFTSVLKRSIKTMHLTLEAMDLLWIPVQKSWRLNERFYGALQGLNKADTIAQYGTEQVQRWRRDPHELPPPITPDDPRYPGHDARYRHLTARELPLTENLSQTITRALPFWTETIVPALRSHQKVLVCAHGNSLRALVQYIDHLSDAEVAELDIPTGTPLVLELDDDLNRLNQYYLEPPTQPGPG
ncbi:2,3-diphosphoglycerate-dependent phosphoglycerate mutase [Hymenobacter rigui]|uniref:2,3-bisphosphoglycerate-dependent phosphoglycerate mutase n=1 Tax=Hymenobacter rigui TaxID=334424 RepID=A0A3R9MUC5_9BACT|nr:2,3-diphosphoglycerate-dependent phosphoglycerate mutase [Hymenobacter rigui]RSK50305.1 2,3-diphosphoglycerate-dependent phosphoglycerate mutase [Hymenobacter rigui]